MPPSHPAAPDELDAQDLERYNRDGYLAFDALLSPDEVTRLLSRIDTMVEGLILEAREGRAQVRLPRGSGNIQDGLYLESFQSNFSVAFEPTVDSLDRPLSQLARSYRKIAGLKGAHPDFDAVLNQPRMLRLVADLMGEEPEFFQDMALCKPARVGSPKLWHQDDVFFPIDDLDAVVGVWIALDAATLENGCMQVLPSWHKRGPLPHRHTQDCEIDPAAMDRDESLALEFAPGGGMLFTGLTPHYTGPNTSEHARRAIQIHFIKPDTGRVTREAYKDIFVTADGVSSTC